MRITTVCQVENNLVLVIKIQMNFEKKAKKNAKTLLVTIKILGIKSRFHEKVLHFFLFYRKKLPIKSGKILHTHAPEMISC